MRQAHWTPLVERVSQTQARLHQAAALAELAEVTLTHAALLLRQSPRLDIRQRAGALLHYCLRADLSGKPSKSALAAGEIMLPSDRELGA